MKKLIILTIFLLSAIWSFAIDLTNVDGYTSFNYYPFTSLIKKAPTATNYYVDATNGSDANTGTSAAFPWKTVQKVNSSFYNAFDWVYFKRGEMFFGSLIANRNQMNFGAYGDNPARPKITGFKELTSLTSIGGNLYTATISTIKKTFQMVTIDGQIQSISMWPDTDSLHKGWLRFTKGIDSSAVIIPNLSSYGAYIPIGVQSKKKSQFWRIESEIITSKSGDTLFATRDYSMTSGGANFREDNTVSGRGIKFTNLPLYCNRDGEYAFNTTSKLFTIYLAGGLSGRTLKYSAVDTVLNLGTKNYINITGIEFEGGNLYLGYGEGNNITYDDCALNYSAGIGINMVACTNGKVLNSRITNCLESGIYTRTNTEDSITIVNNTVKNIGTIAAMGEHYQSGGVAINVVARNFVLIKNNVVDSCGNHGINVKLNNGNISENIVSHFALTKSDNGAYYIYRELVDTVQLQEGLVFENNFAIAGFGEWAGTTSTGSRDANYFYLDGAGKNRRLTGNAAIGVDTNNVGTAFQVNHGINDTIENNIAYNITNIGFYSSKFSVNPSRIVFRNNIIYPFTNTVYTGDSKRLHTFFVDLELNGVSYQNSARRSIVSDSNYFNKGSVTNFKIDARQKIKNPDTVTIGRPDSIYAFVNIPNRTLEKWKEDLGIDVNSVQLPDLPMDKAPLIYNPTDTILKVYLADKYQDVKGNVYFGNTELQPWTWLFLLYKEGITVTPNNSTKGIRWKSNQ